MRNEPERDVRFQCGASLNGQILPFNSGHALTAPNMHAASAIAVWMTCPLLVNHFGRRVGPSASTVSLLAAISLK